MPRYKKYWPEVFAAVLLIIYTIVRTFVVAEGISPFSDARWEVFLAIEIITTPPYVWGMGYIIRSSLMSKEKTSRLKRYIFAYVVVILSFCAPYIYLLAKGALSTSQGIRTLVVLLLLTVGVSLVRRIIARRRASKQ